MAVKTAGVRLIELNEPYRKVLFWFFSFPNARTSLNELSSCLKISKTTARKASEKLISEGFLIKEIHAKTWIIQANQRHRYNFSEKVSFNLAMVYKAYYEQIRKKIQDIVPNPQAVMLFGSYRKGDDNEKSDIDLAVEIQEDKELKIINLCTLGSLGYRKNVLVNLHIFSRSAVNINLFSNIANGILLDGFLEARP